MHKDEIYGSDLKSSEVLVREPCRAVAKVAQLFWSHGLPLSFLELFLKCSKAGTIKAIFIAFAPGGAGAALVSALPTILSCSSALFPNFQAEYW